MTETILIVDDEPAILNTLSGVLSDEGYQVLTAGGGGAALDLLQRESPAVVLLDIWMPDLDGLETLQRIKRIRPQQTVVVMSGHGSIETAVRATKLGAYDYIEKPLSSDKVLLVLAHAITEQQLADENRHLRAAIDERFEILGTSPAIQRLRDQIAVAGPSLSRVLISGENGTGKELAARAIHQQSPRRNRPFIEINCAAIPESLIESELFGYEKGAFTGAVEQKKGRLELANGGTLFLDEIGDMSLPTQAKMLRVLEEREFQRVGGPKTHRMDARIIAASNKSLSDEIQRGRFREDLFYRLNVIPLTVPSLRERKEDIPVLARHFLERFGREQGTATKRLAEDAAAAMISYGWPGNVRELKNYIERLVIMVPGDVITSSSMLPLGSPAAIGPASTSLDGPVRPLKQARAQFEHDHILRALETHRWNISRTAEALGVERSHLHRKIKELGIHGKPTEEQLPLVD
ncbi:MAG: sigma-54-dependent Fis family transcriptional regulator [Nitrospirae bacterium]|nr:sigma-54-dependent Fis family transcriptional regulator [Nitrospirota bacterium]